MKKHNPRDSKWGADHEHLDAPTRRLYTIAKLLRHSLPIVSIEIVTIEQSKKNIGIVVVLDDGVGDVVQVPLKAISTTKSIAAYMRQYPEHVQCGLLIQRVSRFATDEVVLARLAVKLKHILRCAMSFNAFFSKFVPHNESTIIPQKELVRIPYKRKRQCWRANTIDRLFRGLYDTSSYSEATS